MSLDPKILQWLLAGGVPAVLLVIVILLVQEPDRAERLKALVLRPCFRFLRWCGRSYIAAEVGSQANAFLKNHLSTELPGLGMYKVRVKWISGSHDPVLREDGTLVLRLRDANDQTVNALAATRMALPKIVCPLLRCSTEQYVGSAIDMTILRRFADKLGRHAQPVFRSRFLQPEIQNDARVSRLYATLVDLDNAGVFVSVFLEECALLEAELFSTGSTTDLTEEVIGLLEFLLRLANRRIGQEIPLEYNTRHFHIAILLLAVSLKAATEGVRPYVNRVDRAIRAGCESIYVIAFPPASGFFDRIRTTLGRDRRLTFRKRVVFDRRRTPRNLEGGIAQLALYRANRVFGESSFRERVEALALSVGGRIRGTVLDVSQDCALVDCSGLNAFIHKHESSWGNIDSCHQVLVKSRYVEFVVKDLDYNRQQIEVSLRFPETDPWAQARAPVLGDNLKVTVQAATATRLVAVTNDLIEVEIPFCELSWGEQEPANPDGYVGRTLQVVVVARTDHDRRITGSVKRLATDPWPAIVRRFPRGTRVQGRVVAVEPERATVSLDGSITGVVPRAQFEMAGYEYADFERNLVIGQVLDVVVTKVSVKTGRIQLALARNVRS